MKTSLNTYDICIEKATIITMDAADTVIEDGVIGVKNGSISLLEKRCPDVQYQAKETIDARGMLALPGFVNTHVHCFRSLLKGLGADLPLIGWLNKSVHPFGVRIHTVNPAKLAQTRIKPKSKQM